MGPHNGLKHRDQLDAYLKQTEEAEQRVAAAIDSQPPRALRRKVEVMKRSLPPAQAAEEIALRGECTDPADWEGQIEYLHT